VAGRIRGREMNYSLKQRIEATSRLLKALGNDEGKCFGKTPYETFNDLIAEVGRLEWGQAQAGEQIKVNHQAADKYLEQVLELQEENKNLKKELGLTTDDMHHLSDSWRKENLRLKKQLEAATNALYEVRRLGEGQYCWEQANEGLKEIEELEKGE